MTSPLTSLALGLVLFLPCWPSTRRKRSQSTGSLTRSGVMTKPRTRSRPSMWLSPDSEPLLVTTPSRPCRAATDSASLSPTVT